MTELDELLGLALEEHDEKVRKDAGLTPEAQAFIIRHVHYATDELHRLAKNVRESMALRTTKSWRVVCNIQDEMVAVGQCHSRFLWLANLQNKITEPIEYTYGISFNALKIHRQVTCKADGKPTFVFYDPRHMMHGDSFTLVKDRVLFFVKNADFDSAYA